MAILLFSFHTSLILGYEMKERRSGFGIDIM